MQLVVDVRGRRRPRGGGSLTGCPQLGSQDPASPCRPMPAAVWSGRRASDRRGANALTSDPSAAGARRRRSPPSTWGRLAGHRRCPNAAGVISQGRSSSRRSWSPAGVHEEGSLEFRPGNLRNANRGRHVDGPGPDRPALGGAVAADASRSETRRTADSQGGRTRSMGGCQATSGIDPPATPKTDPPKKRRMLLKWWVFR